MNRFLLPTARLCSAIWVGAALLFVATSVTEQVQPSFDGDTKDTLALIRFPWYYGTGMPLLLAGGVAAALAGRKAPSNLNPATIASLLLLFANLLLWIDYTTVYRPLRLLLIPAGSARGADFERLHFWSECLNSVGFLLSAAAAVMLSAARDRAPVAAASD